MTTPAPAPAADSNDAALHWLKLLGINDLQSGLTRARGALKHVTDAVRSTLGNTTEFTSLHMVFAGLAARTTNLHDAILREIEAGNPHATFTLLRAYAENAAAIFYLKEHPSKVNNFWRGPQVGIGKITNHAAKRFANFKHIYGQLSEYAHPASASILASFHMIDDKQFAWTTGSRFKGDIEALFACAWLVELAEATGHLLMELGRGFATNISESGRS